MYALYALLMIALVGSVVAASLGSVSWLVALCLFLVVVGLPMLVGYVKAKQ